jgi:hypothetical protein
MFKLHPITSRLDTWSWNPNKMFLELRNRLTNKPLVTFQMVSVQNEESDEVYQHILWLEPRGEIDIIATPDQRIIFLQIERYSVISPRLYQDNWGEDPPNPFEYTSGVIEYELPRGIADSYKIEAEEETLYQVEHIATIGYVNANTAYCGTSPLIAVYKALPHRSDKFPAPSERIRKVELFTPKEVAHIETLCGLTKASLWEFCQWALTKQEDDFWIDIAKGIVSAWVEYKK